ncbi:NnrU family protein [Kordiimonas lacus]|nr:NnrU family protein [Kordiimonas lacus]
MEFFNPRLGYSKLREEMMTLLVLGLALFFLLHLVPIFAREARSSVISRIGALPYKGLFALASISSLFLVYKGWTLTDPVFVYEAPRWAYHLTALLVLLGFILFIASNAPTNIRRIIRHPQLTSIILWSAGHMMVNGETRSLLLFGGFLIWSLISILGSNHRDGEWEKPERVSTLKDVVTVLIALVLYGVFAVWVHEWLIGVSPMPPA